jgi:hypothetical protein
MDLLEYPAEREKTSGNRSYVDGRKNTGLIYKLIIIK